MPQYRVRKNQSIYDVAAQLYGDISFAVQVMNDNSDIISDLSDIVEANTMITYTLSDKPLAVDFATKRTILTTLERTEAIPPDLTGAILFYTQWAIPLNGTFEANIVETIPVNPVWTFQAFSQFEAVNLSIPNRNDLEPTELNGTVQPVALTVDDKTQVTEINLDTVEGIAIVDTSSWTGLRSYKAAHNLFDQPVIDTWFNNVAAFIDVEDNNWATSVINQFLAHILAKNGISTAAGRVINLMDNATGDTSTVSTVTTLRSSYNITPEIVWLDGDASISRAVQPLGV